MARKTYLRLVVDHTPRSQQPDYHWYVLAALCYLVLGAVEIGGAMLSGSLIILSDAIHVAIDALVMGLSAYVHWQARHTDNLIRVKRMFARGTMANGVLLMIGSFLVLREALPRLQESLIPHAVDVHRAVWVIALALPAHLLIFFLIKNHVHDHFGKEVRHSALWHAAEDMVVMTVAAISLGLVEHTGTTWWDLQFSFLVACAFLARGAWFVYSARNKLINLRLQELAMPSGRDGS